MNRTKIFQLILIFTFLISSCTKDGKSSGSQTTDPQTTDKSPVINQARETAGWKSAGLDVESVYSLIYNPNSPEIFYAGTKKKGVFKSTDSGKTWKEANKGLDGLFIRALAIDPTAPDTIYAATKGNGLYKTTNGAESWSRVAAKSPSEEGACTYVNVISIDPTNTNIIYIAGANTSNIYGIYKSEDGGKSFVKLFQPVVGITSLQISPADSKVIYAASYGAGIYKSVDGGITWQSYNKGMVDQYLRTVAIDPSSPETIYAGSNQSGIYKSVDAGQTWVAINNGFRGVSGVFGASVQTILIDSQAKVIYVGALGNGIFKSIDGGNSWYDINKDLIVNNSYPYINCFMLEPAKKILYAGTDDYGVISYE